MKVKGVKRAVTYMKSLVGRDGFVKVYLNTACNEIEVFHCVNKSEHLNGDYVELCVWDCQYKYGKVDPVPTMKFIKEAVQSYEDYLLWQETHKDVTATYSDYRAFIC